MNRTNKIYETEISLSSENNGHVLALKRILSHAKGASKTILEVGCATGYFGEQLCQRGHEVLGIEPSPAADQASKRLTRVRQCSIEEFIADCNEKFDCIIFGDVLEHLVNPEEVLTQCKSLLKNDGVIFVCLPNVAHLSVRLMLLEGRWEYSDLGIMDNTHLHFFTLESILSLFRDCGYAIETLDRTYAPLDHGLITVNKDLHHEVSSFIQDDEQFTFQYMITAHKTESVNAPAQCYAENSKVRILCLLPLLDWVAGDIRLRKPLSEWQAHYGGVVRFHTFESYGSEDVEWCDIAVIQRVAEPSVSRLIRQLRQSGKRVIFEIDDLLTEVPLFLETGHYYEAVKPHLETILGCANLVTVTTPLLGRNLGKYNDNVQVISSVVSEAYYQTHHSDDELSHLIIASSDSIQMDMIIPALREVTAKYDNIRIVAVGPPGDSLVSAGLEVIQSGNLPYSEFGSYITQFSNGIGIIPLDKSLFSSCKSPIKYLDYSNHNIPVVASNVSPYADVIENGVTGLLINNNAGEWVAGIGSLIESKSRRIEVASEAKDHIRSAFTYESAAAKWNDAITRVLEDESSLLPGKATRSLLSVNRSLAYRMFRPQSYLALARLAWRSGPRAVIRHLRRNHDD